MKNSNITVLAVKPLVYPKILHEIAPAVGPNNLIISVAAGVTIKSIEQVFLAISSGVQKFIKFFTLL